MADVSRKTYAIENSGPYDEDEAREKIRAYCDEHGFFAAATLTVVEMSEDGGTSGRRVDAGQFLDGHQASEPLAHVLSRRRSCERIAEALFRWSRGAQNTLRELVPEPARRRVSEVVIEPLPAVA